MWKMNTIAILYVIFYIFFQIVILPIVSRVLARSSIRAFAISRKKNSETTLKLEDYITVAILITTVTSNIIVILSYIITISIL